MEPTQTPTQNPPTPTETPPTPGTTPSPMPDPSAPTPATPASGQPPTNPVATNQAASAGKNRTMIYVAVGVVVLLAAIYFLFMRG
jgi:uncharacterized protein HemX